MLLAEIERVIVRSDAMTLGDWRFLGICLAIAVGCAVQIVRLKRRTPDGVPEESEDTTDNDKRNDAVLGIIVFLVIGLVSLYVGGVFRLLVATQPSPSDAAARQEHLDGFREYASANGIELTFYDADSFSGWVSGDLVTDATYTHLDDNSYQTSVDDLLDAKLLVLEWVKVNRAELVDYIRSTYFTAQIGDCTLDIYYLTAGDEITETAFVDEMGPMKEISFNDAEDFFRKRPDCLPEAATTTQPTG